MLVFVNAGQGCECMLVCFLSLQLIADGCCVYLLTLRKCWLPALAVAVASNYVIITDGMRQTTNKQTNMILNFCWNVTKVTFACTGGKLKVTGCHRSPRVQNARKRIRKATSDRQNWQSQRDLLDPGKVTIVHRQPMLGRRQWASLGPVVTRRAFSHVFPAAIFVDFFYLVICYDIIWWIY